jgi:peroxiredoxin
MKHFALLAVALVPGLAWADDKAPVLVTKVASFTLRDYRGAEVSLEQFAAKKAVVLAFVGCECPVAKLYGPRLARLAKAYEAQGVQFLGIDANQQDGVTQIGRFATDAGIEFPMLKDVKNVVADRLGVERTTEAIVLDGTRTIRYRGRIDDQYNVGISRTKTTQNDLSAALDELLAGKPISRPTTPAVGCFIGRVHKSAGTGTVTFAKDVARILNKHCVECHRPGEIGPFSLTSYDEAIGWADTIDEVVRQGRMPPWHADPKYGHFANDSRLTADEKKTIADWVQAGTPEGDPKETPAAPTFAEGWRIPKPDVVFTVPKPFKVKATGTIDYQFFVIDTGFTEDKWIQAAEVKPSCRAVVHHALIFAQTPSEPLVLNLDAMALQKGAGNRGGGPQPGGNRPGGGPQQGRNRPDGGPQQGGNRPGRGPRGRGPNDGGFISKWLAADVPGARPMWLPDGMAKRVPAGSRLVLQIHYTATGAPQEDQCSIGLVFTDPRTVRKEVVTDMVVNPRFEIPPGDPDYKVEAERVLEQDEELLTLMPHTHVRGIGFKYEAIYPDGKKEVLLNVPQYDFSWQNTYVLTEPKLLPKGTTLRGEAHYNNSKSNLANPDPTQTVRWGEQTWEEMMIGYYDRTLVGEDRIKHPVPTPERPGTKTPPALDAELARLANAALESQTAFDAFAMAVHEKLPQVDRVCVTSVQDGNYVVRRAAYPGKKVAHFAETGFQAPARIVPMTGFALIDRVVSLPDLNALGSSPQLKMITAALKSSVHVPVSIDGLPSNVNFWSAQPKAFPEGSLAMLQSLAAKVVSKN